jgi:hypothetical protein
LFRCKFASRQRLESVAAQMKIGGDWGLRGGDGSERQHANQEKSKSHFVSSFLFLNLLLLANISRNFVPSICIYGQSIHLWPSHDK